ncbi:hypothetical protein JI62_02495 [Halomonas campaniensis]|uniref:Uncharacterized protein n=1 Tax=Halomonas campaniensis TaxID=213554 RepID=A0A246S493_9GAMM|nr:hypothetical protein JI62_02495 [Halomonas campaniensis]
MNQLLPKKQRKRGGFLQRLGRITKSNYILPLRGSLSRKDKCPSNLQLLKVCLQGGSQTPREHSKPVNPLINHRHLQDTANSSIDRSRILMR